LSHDSSLSQQPPPVKVRESILSLGSQHYVGLTDWRFILLQLKGGKPSGEVYGIWRDRIEKPKWTGGVAKFKLPKDSLILNFGNMGRMGTASSPVPS
jgi:hypothetical protein